MRKKIKISTVGDYLNQVKKAHYVYIPDAKQDFRQTRLFFRGHANSTWALLPKLMRKVDEKSKEKNNNLAPYEYELLRDAQNKLWAELTNQQTYLEKLAYFQHYGLPTRLLDVTTNPLVALYFACGDENNFEEDGVVHVGYIQDENVEVVHRMVEYIYEHEYTDFLNSNIDRQTQELFSRPYYIYPAVNSARINHQSGEFLIAPLTNYNSLIDSFERIKYYDFKSCFEKKIIIPHASKRAILQELDECGINESTLFPDAEHQLKSIEDKYKSYSIKLNI